MHPSFLTHTVQMKQKYAYKPNIYKCSLLNPHGSDETIDMIRVNAYTKIFLTHTVQMKQVFINTIITFMYNFLTHTVQMKPKRIWR